MQVKWNGRYTATSLSSSSDCLMHWFSDDEEVCNCVHRLCSRESKQQVPNYVDDVVKNYSYEEFRRNFRLSRNVAYKKIDVYRESPHYKFKTDGGKKGVSAESQCLAFLCFGANKTTYREVSNLFNVASSASHTHLTNVLEFFFDISSKIIKFPETEEEKVKKSVEFQQVAGFSNVLGCVDGSYIYVRKPAHKVRSTYVNRHVLISITLHGICDANKKFLDAFIGSASRIHDSRIFKLSFIFKKIPDICSEKYHILGDQAYPLREYLITPFKDFGNLDNRKRIFNKKHYQTRVKIENTFGLLKQRFRQLVRLDFFIVGRMCKFVLACCVVHNLCIENGDLWDEDETTETNEEERINTLTNEESTEPLSDGSAQTFR